MQKYGLLTKKRLKLGYTQKDVAKKTGLAQTTISKYENKFNNYDKTKSVYFKLDTLFKILTCLKINLKELEGEIR